MNTQDRQDRGGSGEPVGDGAPVRGQDKETEERILDAAHVVFLRRGTAGARTQEIADEAGVNKALLHYYFRSKERLAEAVFRRAAGRLMSAVLGVLGSDASLEEKVERVVHIELATLLENPLLPGYVVGELTHHPERVGQLVQTLTGTPVDKLAPRLFEVLGQQLEERSRRGTLRHISPEQFVINLVSLCVFPFAARPLVSALLGLDQQSFEAFIGRRKSELPAFFLNALRP